MIIMTCWLMVGLLIIFQVRLAGAQKRLFLVRGGMQLPGVMLKMSLFLREWMPLGWIK